jgi:hypothetical protein
MTAARASENVTKIRRKGTADINRRKYVTKKDHKNLLGSIFFCHYIV